MTDRRVERRPWLGLRMLFVVAAIGGVASAGFAWAPVERESLVYEYRPASDAPRMSAGSEVAVAPLALARPSADALRLELPCAEPGSVFSTSVSPEWFDRRGSLTFLDLGNALFVYVREDAVEAMSNGRTFLSLGIDPAPGCLAVLDYDGGSWRLEAQGGAVEAESGPVRMWEAGFEGPAARDPMSVVTVETRELGTTPGALQLGFLVVAVAALGLVMREIVVRGSSGPRSRVIAMDRLARRTLRHLSWVDLGVISMLVIWTMLIPANIDDGWIAARVNSYSTHGDIAGIYTVGAAPMPFGYWLEWLQHLWFGLSSVVVVMRLPAFLLGLATWFGVRSIGRSLGMPGSRGSVWLMAAAFVLGFGAWGMTLRAEPVIAALMVASLALGLRFVRGQRGWVIVAWLLVMALAASAHPAGIIVAAPLIASWKPVWRWVKSSSEAAAVAIVGLVALGSATVLLWLVDSNLASTSESIDAYRSAAHGKSIADELFRYRLLDEAPYATTMRRLFVGLIVLAVAAFFLRRRQRDDVRALPAWALVVALLLLTLTPSKWPWHLGGLIGLVALVLSLELRQVDRQRWVLAAFGVVAVASWTWSVSLPWTVFDLRTYGWTEFEPLTEKSLSQTGLLPFELSSLVGWTITAAVVGILAVALVRWRPDLHPPNPPEASTLLVVSLAVAMTASTLWSDVTDTPAWTFGAQNFASVRGEETCGLGDELVVPVPGSLHGLNAGGESDPDADLAARRAGFSERGSFESAGFLYTDQNTVLPAPSAETIGSWATSGPAIGEASTGKYRSAWFTLEPADDDVVLFVMGSYRRGGDSDLGNAVGLQWGIATMEGVMDAGVELPPLQGYFIDWTMLQFDRPEGVDRVRLLLRDDTIDGREAWVASTLPMALSVATIGDVAPQATIVISPPLAPYFPCVEVPQFDRSIVPMPGMFVETWKVLWEDTYTGSASDRWFKIDVVLDPPLGSDQIGAHTGDTKNFVFVSQEYLTGVPARITGEFSPR